MRDGVMIRQNLCLLFPFLVNHILSWTPRGTTCTPRHCSDSLIKYWDLFPLLGLLCFRSQETVTPHYHRFPTLTGHKDHHIWTTRILVPPTDLFRQLPTSLIRFYSYCDQPLVKPGRRHYPINPQGCTISLVHNLTY